MLEKFGRMKLNLNQKINMHGNLTDKIGNIEAIRKTTGWSTSWIINSIRRRISTSSGK
jgi:hypothetical protein